MNDMSQQDKKIYLSITKTNKNKHVRDSGSVPCQQPDASPQ